MTTHELQQEILRLKKEKNVCILAHAYQSQAVLEVADYTGDSYGLSVQAAKTDAAGVIMCGVRFMAETCKILNPNKLVHLPAKVAGCSLAESITAEDVRKLRSQYPGVPIVTYINTYADVKAEVDICCTSSNAAKVVASLNSDTVIFLPDEYLARNVAAETGKTIIFPFDSEKRADTKGPTMIGWRGRCEVHEKFTVQDIENARKQFPGVCVVSHPECSPEVVAASDYANSTTKMVDFVKKTKAPHFLILTECSMGDNIIAENPDKDILRLCSVRCPHMNEITLEDTLAALRFDRYEIEVPEDIRVRAKSSLDRMLAVRP